MDTFLNNILHFPEQLGRGGLSLLRLSLLRGATPDGIVVVGMGGSGLAGEILTAVRHEIGLRLPLYIWKDYGLPQHPFARPLMVFLSFSGDTEETLSGFRELTRKSDHRTYLAAVGGGGTLLRLAEKRNIPSVAFAAGDLTPRQAVGRMFYSLKEILLALRLRVKIPDYTHLSSRRFALQGKTMARKLRRRLIHIYTSEPHRHIGYLWKVSLNETAKVPAFANSLPEMNHNELAEFDAPKKGFAIPSAALFFTDARFTPRLKKRFRVTETLLTHHHVATSHIPLTGNALLEQTWNAAVLAQWTSYFLAKENYVPLRELALPSPKIVRDLKRRMK